MSIALDKNAGLVDTTNRHFGLECPHCGIYAHMTPQSLPDFDALADRQPSHVGVVLSCDACKEPVFLRFDTRSFDADRVELGQHFEELERPKERFPFAYLPKETETHFREALSCYTNNLYNAFACMCRRSARAAFAAMGDNGKLQAFDDAMTAQKIAEIDDDLFEPARQVLFGTGDDDSLPTLNRAQAGVLLEILKDLYYQSFVRRGKLMRAIKVRRLFVQDGNGSRASSS